MEDIKNGSTEYKEQQTRIHSLKRMSDNLKKAIQKAGLPEKKNLFFFYLLKGDMNFFQTWSNKKAKTFVSSYTDMNELEKK